MCVNGRFNTKALAKQYQEAHLYQQTQIKYREAQMPVKKNVYSINAGIETPARTEIPFDSVNPPKIPVGSKKCVEWGFGYG